MHADGSHPRTYLESQTTKQSGLYGDWQTKCIECFWFEVQIVELHVAFEYGDLERLGIKPIYIASQVLVQIEGYLTFQHSALCCLWLWRVFVEITCSDSRIGHRLHMGTIGRYT